MQDRAFCRDFAMEVNVRRQDCSKRNVFHSNAAIFREYVDSSATKFLTNIFNSKYNVLKRLFWLAVFLVATALFLVNFIERFQLLISSPTSTAFLNARVKPAPFPAVTVCNLNRITRTGLDHEGLLQAAAAISDIGNLESDYLRRCEAVIDGNTRAKQVIIDNLKRTAVQPLNKFIEMCEFMGQDCQLDRDFVRTEYSYGMCYTFNGYSRVPSLQTNGTGSLHGLHLTVNISQDEYIGSELHDAGVKIFVHPSSEPARVLDQGIAVPPGAVLYAGMEQRDVINKAGVDCAANGDNSRFNFLGNTFNYSEHGCLQDCVLTEIAKICDCYYIKSEIPPSNPSYATIRDCTFADICCIERVSFTSLDCDCPTACESTSYDLTTSYSKYPALYLKEPTDTGTNILEVSVYFQTLVVSRETTTFSYTFTGFVSDTGGLLSLYLGIGLISLAEVVLWVVEEFVDRLCCYKLSFQRKKKDEGNQPFGMDTEEENEDAAHEKEVKYSAELEEVTI